MFSRIHARRRTPYLAVALVGVATLPFVLFRALGRVAGLANAALLVAFVLVSAALVKLRYDDPATREGFTAPLTVGRPSVTALAGLLTSAGLFTFYVAGVL